MRERINRLAKGIIDSEAPSLLLQSAEISEIVRAGEVTRREIYVTSENGLHIKGLAYSSDARVTIPNHAFGGLRNHIGYEVNSMYLEYGDEIKGSFYLVTNGGEREIPYSFRVEAGDSGKVLGRLKTARDFADIARQDYDLALRLFEYKDFTEVPFMQDLHARAMYDGLKGMGSRQIQLEEFLIGLGVKKPVRILADCRTRTYEDVEDAVRDEIEIHKEGWGFLPVSIKADGAFIQIANKKITAGDFEGDVCRLAYQISPSRLHGGNNYGAIVLSTMSETLHIPIAVMNRQEAAGSGEARMKNRYGRYMMLRLDYESQIYEPALLLNQMMEELDQLRMVNGEDELLQLVTAEFYVLSGRREQAAQILEECTEKILDIRLERPDLYCLLQYVMICIKPEETQKASFIRLLHKYMEEGEADYLKFYLLTQLDETLQDSPGDMLMQMKELYLSGCHSPFLYLQAARMLNQAPEMLYGMGSFEIQVLHFGSRRGMLSEELALKTARFACMAKYYNRLYCSMLMTLYKTYPCKEVLEAICSMLIKGERRSPVDFVWYEKALKAGLSLTRLYEYYLFSLPEDFNQLIPKEVLLYFSYAHELDRHSKSVLYKNILTYMKTEDSLYREYERDMEKFATEQIFESRINNRLAVIYEHMIYPDMIDLPVAKVLPGILKSYRISCNRSDMKYAVICYEELMEEGVYPLTNGIAYAPLFSKYSQILFQDAYGNRYTDIGCVKTPVMNKPELERRCFEVYPEHPMLLLNACREAGEKENLEEKDVQLIEQALSELKLHPLYKKVLTAKVIQYYQMRLNGEEPGAVMDGGYLLSVDKKMLTRAQRTSICETLIQQNYIREAYEMIQEYGYEGIQPKRLLKLCTKMILEQLFDQDDLLLNLAYQVFREGISDSVVLDYLCEYFNGTSSQMYRVLRQGISQHVETYDMEERLLAQMLFSDQATFRRPEEGERSSKVDQVFTLYMAKKKTSESIVKAYFTMKSSDYFLHDMHADDQVFAYLEGMINGAIEKDKLSTIYLLALTKYYATLPVLEDDQKALCQSIVSILLGEGMVFPYFKSLAVHVSIPDEVLDKGIIEYRGQKDSRVDLQIRILPDEERYHSDDMKRVYQGIFIKQKVLFEGETLEYQIYERKGDQRLLMDEGQVTCDLPSSQAGDSRFCCLNQMALCLSLKEEEGLKRTMKEYLTRTVTVEGLFELM